MNFPQRSTHASHVHTGMYGLLERSCDCNIPCACVSVCVSVDVWHGSCSCSDTSETGFPVSPSDTKLARTLWTQRTPFRRSCSQDKVLNIFFGIKQCLHRPWRLKQPLPIKSQKFIFWAFLFKTLVFMRHYTSFYDNFLALRTKLECTLKVKPDRTLANQGLSMMVT